MLTAADCHAARRSRRILFPTGTFTYTNNISEDGLPQLNSPTVGGCNTTQGT